MSRAKRPRFPVSQLPRRYSVNKLTVYGWLDSLKVQPKSWLGKLYINIEQLRLLDRLHSHIQQGGAVAYEDFIKQFHSYCEQGGTIADFVEIDAVFDLLAQKVALKTKHVTQSPRESNKATIKDYCIEKIRMFFNYKWEASYSEKINFHSWAILIFFIIATAIAFGISLYDKNSKGTPSNLLIGIAIILLLDIFFLIVSTLFLLWFMLWDVVKNWKSSEELTRDRIKKARKEALEDGETVRDLYRIANQENLQYVELRFKSLIEQRKDSASLDDDFLRILVLFIVVGFYVFTSGSAVQSLLGSLLQSLKVDPVYAGLVGPLSIFSGLVIILSPFFKLPSQRVIADYKKCMFLLEQAQATSNHTEPIDPA